jgi:hypothetical protein
MTAISSIAIGIDGIVTPEDLVTQHPNLFTHSQVNWLIKARKVNGLQTTGAVLKVGRRFYLDKKLFVEWFLAHKGGA